LNKRIFGRVSSNEPTIFLNDEALSSGVDDSQSEFKGKHYYKEGHLQQFETVISCGF
jgi:hypothetical protein